MFNKKLLKNLSVGIVALGLLTPIAMSTINKPQITIQAKRHYRIHRRRPRYRRRSHKSHRRYRRYNRRSHRSYVGQYLNGEKIHFDHRVDMYYTVSPIHTTGVAGIMTPHGEKLVPANRAYYSLNDLIYSINTEREVRANAPRNRAFINSLARNWGKSNINLD